VSLRLERLIGGSLGGALASGTAVVLGPDSALSAGTPVGTRPPVITDVGAAKSDEVEVCVAADDVSAALDVVPSGLDGATTVEVVSGALEGAAVEAVSGALEGAAVEVVSGALEGAAVEVVSGALEGAEDASEIVSEVTLVLTVASGSLGAKEVGAGAASGGGG
jgi:hypothetical protein